MFFLAWWAWIQATAVECHTYCFLWDNCTCYFQVYLKILKRGPWPLDKSSDNYFTSRSEILRGAPGHGQFMVKRYHFHFWIMAPKVLNETYRAHEMWPSVTISMFCNNNFAKFWERSLLLPIIKCFLCDTLVTRHLFTGHQLGLNQLILISTDKGQDCFLITDRFQLCLGFPCLFAPPFIHAFNTFPCVILL